MTTLTSLDKDKVHILAVPNMCNDALERLYDYLETIHREYHVRIVALPLQITGLLSKEMTDKEFEDLKEAIKDKKGSHEGN